MLDCVVIGGGLAGLSAAILLVEQGFSVTLFEKKKYPFHRVCGEYIAMESYSFIQRLGIELDEMDLPRINHLIISSLSGHTMEHDISPGGIGISRFKLDYLLVKRAKALGVDIQDGVNVLDIEGDAGEFLIKTSMKEVFARSVIGGFGKRSNLDASLNREHRHNETKRNTKYIAVKYHIRSNLPANRIELHNFKNGYCGLSRIEEDRTCLCYLTTAYNLKISGSIKMMEENILSQNPYLKRYFSDFPQLYKNPLTISNIFFKDKALIEKGVILAGDAAGLITPLCGNGMGMAMHSAAMIGGLLPYFLKGKITFSDFSSRYEFFWRKNFKTRLKAGRVFQKFFGNPIITNLFIRALSKSNFITQKLVRLTHGVDFGQYRYVNANKIHIDNG